MKLVKTVLACALCAALAAALTACAATPAPAIQPAASVAAPPPAPASAPPQAPEPEPEAETEPALTVTDQAGRTVEITGPVERIVSGYYISSSACIALGLAEKMAGIEAKAASRPIYGLAAPALLELPDVGTAKEFNLEGALALEPDLAILPMRLKDAAETLTEMGVPAVLVNPESYEGLCGMITLIGEAAGAIEAAEKLLGYYDGSLASIKNLTEPLSEAPSVYMCGVSSYLETAPKDMYQATLISLAGGVNAAGEIEGDGWAEISYEQLLALDPGFIVIPPEAGYGAEDILGDEQLKGLGAVQNGRVYKMPSAFEAWDSPVPSCMLGTRWLLATIHPQVYSIASLREDAARFYREFYGFEIDIALIEGQA